jgi:cytochrome b pre-mRNA-processing protein 3
MISFPFRRSPGKLTIDALYGAIVTQARSPAFYCNYGVPDTVAGRTDMIVLHLVLVLQRLCVAQPSDQSAGKLVGQQLFDRFCEDMDDNFREMGVGDLAVPKHMRRVGEAFYGRAKAYEAALAAGDAGALAAALARNVFGEADHAGELPLGARRLAAYMREGASRLAAQTIDALSRAELDFPVPSPAGRPVQEGHP